MTAFKDWLNGLTSKTTPVDADEVYVRDSSGTPSSKKLTWANLKATLANTFLSLTGGTIASGTKTASDPALTVTQTWNNATATFAGKVTNITDTASASGSVIEDWQVGGVSKAAIRKDGALVLSGPSSGYASIVGTAPARECVLGIGLNAAGGASLALLNQAGTVSYSALTPGGVICVSSGYLGITSGSLSSAVDVRLYRDAAGTIAQRNSTDAQTSRIYGTSTDGSNYRRVAISMTTAGVAAIAPEGAGTGAVGNVLHISGLPTSNPGAGILWNDSGTVKVGT